MNLQPVIFGEVLFDQFPDGHSVLGGAPFNVAWNLQGVGRHPFFISATGADPSGYEIRDTMTLWRMNLNGLQTHPGLPTGRVVVSFNDGEPSYEILADQAWDHIEFRPQAWQLENIPLIYHGSLAWRSQQNRESIQQLRQRYSAPVFVDLNIRLPWFDHLWLDELLVDVRWLKLNLSELEVLTESTVVDLASAQAATRAIQDRFGCQSVFVTAGAEGAMFLDGHGKALQRPATRPETLVDTVGAGDAFSAAIIHGILSGWDDSKILVQATSMASRVCQLRGATTNDPGFYQLAGKASS